MNTGNTIAALKANWDAARVAFELASRTSGYRSDLEYAADYAKSLWIAAVTAADEVARADYEHDRQGGLERDLEEFHEPECKCDRCAESMADAIQAGCCND